MGKRSSLLTAECETAVTAYLMKVEDVDCAMDIFPHLKQDIWRSYGMTVAMSCELLEMGSTPEQQRQYLQPSYLKIMTCKESFTFDEMTQAVVVVHGQVHVSYKVNMRLKEQRQFQPHVVNAPTVIKPAFDPNFKQVEQILAPMNADADDAAPVMLVVPVDRSEDADHQIDIIGRMSKMGGPSAAFVMASQRIMGSGQRGSAFKKSRESCPPSGPGILNNAVRPSSTFED